MPAASPIVPVAGDALLRPLIHGESVCGHVLVATRGAVYVTLDPRPGAEARPGTCSDTPLVGVLTRAAARVPGSVVLAADASEVIAALRPGDEVVVGAGGLAAAGVRLVPSRWWDSRVPRIRTPLGGLVAPETAPELPLLPDPVRAAARALDRALAGGHPESLGHAVADLVGLGPGLTPAGDDVLAGALVTLTALGDGDRRDGLAAAVRPLLRRTTVVSGAFLQHAADGRAVPELARFVRVLASGGAVGPVVQDLLRVGASSGAALAWGARAALRATAGHLPTSVEVA